MKKNVLKILFLVTTFFFISFKLYSIPSKTDLFEKNKDIDLLYNELVSKLQTGINRHDEETIKSAFLKIKNIADKQRDEVAARASYVIAIYYYKNHINDYESAKSYLLKAITYASEASPLITLARNEYDKLDLYLEKIKPLALSKSYSDHMKLAALYSAPYLRDYKYSLMIYDSLLRSHPIMEAEIIYAKAYLYLSDDLKVRDFKKAEENLSFLMENHKDFKLYPDVVYLLAEIKGNLDKNSSEIDLASINSAISLLKLAEKSYLEKIKAKKREADPEFLNLIRNSRETLLAKVKGKPGNK